VEEKQVKIIGNLINKKNAFIIPYSLKISGQYFYVIDRLSHKLYKYDMEGNGGEMSVSGDKSSGGLHFPYDLLIINDLIYIADGGNYRIIVCDLKGNYLFEFGGFGFNDNQFNDGGIFNGDGRSSNPQSLFLDNDGNINTIDIMNKCIKVFNPKGYYIRKYSFGGMKSYGVCVMDQDGSFFISDPAQNKIKCYDQNLDEVWSVGKEGYGPAEFQVPWRIVLHKNNLLYVSDIYNHRIQIFNKKGTYISQFGHWGSDTQGFNYIFGFDIDGKGKIYLTDTWNHRVKIYNNEYLCEKIIYKYQDDLVLRPAAVKFANDEKTFLVADYLNHSIAIFDSDGNYIKRFGQLGSGKGEFKYPNDIFITSEGWIYVSDSKNRRIQIFDKAGTFLNLFPLPEDKVNMIPSSVVVYKDKIYVADIENSMIHVFNSITLSYEGIIAGKGQSYGNVLSNYKTAFMRLDIWQDQLIIADSSNNRIQMYDITKQRFIKEESRDYCIPTRARVINNETMLVVNRGNNTIQIDYTSDRNSLIIGKGPGNQEDELIAPWDADYCISSELLIILDSLNNRIKLMHIKLLNGGI